MSHVPTWSETPTEKVINSSKKVGQKSREKKCVFLHQFLSQGQGDIGTARKERAIKQGLMGQNMGKVKNDDVPTLNINRGTHRDSV